MGNPKLRKEAQRQTEVQQRPFVILEPTQRTHSGDLIGLRLKNIGNGAATNIRVRNDPDSAVIPFLAKEETWIAPQLTVVMNTTSQRGVVAHGRDAHAAWAGSNTVVAQATTVVLRLSSNDLLIPARVIEFSSAIPMSSSANAGCAAKWRHAAAIFVYPAQRINLMTVLRSAAMTCGIALQQWTVRLEILTRSEYH
jgi:hypothetical protein